MDFRSFIQLLKNEGELKRVKAELNPIHEMAAVMKRLEKETIQSAQATAKSSEQFKKAEREADRLADTIQKHGVSGPRALKKLKREYKALEIQIKRTGADGSKSLDKLRKSIERTERQTQKTKRGFKDLAGTMVGVMGGAQMLRVGKDMVMTAANFEEAMIRVGAISAYNKSGLNLLSIIVLFHGY